MLRKLPATWVILYLDITTDESFVSYSFCWTLPSSLETVTYMPLPVYGSLFMMDNLFVAESLHVNALGSFNPGGSTIRGTHLFNGVGLGKSNQLQYLLLLHVTGLQLVNCVTTHFLETFTIWRFSWILYFPFHIVIVITL